MTTDGSRRTSYDADYPTCAYTEVWLRIMDASLDHDEVTRALGLLPTKISRVGDLVAPRSKRTRKASGWFLESKDQIESRDSRHHFDWLLDRIKDKGPVLQEFARRGYLVDICCRFDSTGGTGGPTFMPEQLSALGRLGIEVWFDLYLAHDIDAVATESTPSENAG